MLVELVWDCVCSVFTQMAVNKPTCRTGRGLMFRLETSTNRPKWMREHGSDSRQVPRGHRAENLLKHLPVFGAELSLSIRDSVYLFPVAL